MSFSKKLFFKQSFWNTAGIVFALGSEWLVMLLLPKIIDFEKTGIYSLAFSTSQMFYTLAIFSVRDYQVMSAYDNEPEKAFFSFRLYTILLSFSLFLIYSFILGYNGETFFSLFFFVVGVAFVAAAEIMLGALQLENRLDVTGYCGIFNAVCRVFFFFIVYKITKSFLTAVLFGQVIVGILYFIMVYKFYINIKKQLPPFNIHFHKEMLKIAKKTFPLFLVTVISLFITVYPRIIIEKKDGNVILGYYSLLISFSSVITSIAIFLFAPLMKPYSELFKAGKYQTLKDIHLKVLFLGFALFILAGIFSICFVPIFLNWYYGKKILDYINVFYLGLVASCFFSLAQLSRPIMVVAGKSKKIAYIQIFNVVIFSIITPILIEHFSVNGGAMSILIVYILFFIFIVSSVRSELNRGIKS